MELGCDGIFVSSGVFKSGNTVRRGRAIVQAVHYFDLKVLAVVSCGVSHKCILTFENKRPQQDSVASFMSTTLKTPLLEVSAAQQYDQSGPSVQVIAQNYGAVEVGESRQGVDKALSLFNWPGSIACRC
ncbi:hypothetical protein RJ639_005352 [Escallonia herrerae]|uniref:Uncharacterized protein n=1 Tax=Escallonia herrerae TaxID=1293975 RepID=A0AA88VZF1_9ASTE|nr:hypothetical protein RJ639_005352 [Escallonia herrerae]